MLTTSCFATRVEREIANGTFGRPGAGIEQIAVGGMHSLLIDAMGRVSTSACHSRFHDHSLTYLQLWSWGVNDGGALGRRTAQVVLDPTADVPAYADRDRLESIPGLVLGLGPDNDFRVTQAAAGDSVSVAISSTGRLKYWGSFRGTDGLLGFGNTRSAIQIEPVDLFLSSLPNRSSNVVAVAAGNDHVLALASDGRLYSFGDNAKCQLGRKIPPRARIRALAPEPLALKSIQVIGAGEYHSFAVDADGRVWAWGLNAWGQCGIAPDKRDRAWEEGVVERPTVVDALLPSRHNGATVIKVDAGSCHSLFLFDNGSLWSCGLNDDNQLGLANDHPALQPQQGSDTPPKAVFEPVQVSDCGHVRHSY
jgi:regulator of chromosome condensation